MELDDAKAVSIRLMEVLGGDQSARRVVQSLAFERIGNVWLATPPRDLMGVPNFLVSMDGLLVRCNYSAHHVPTEAEIRDGSWATSDQLKTLFPRANTPAQVGADDGHPPVDFTQEELDWLDFIQSGKWQEQGMEPPPMPESLSRKLDQ